MSAQPSKRERRVHSARARLTPDKDKYDSFRQQQQQQEALTKEARERATSAKAIKDKHHGSSKLFPRPPSRSSRERFTSSYSKDFDGTFLPPAELRPTSPTRRNNPHPAKVKPYISKAGRCILKGGGAGFLLALILFHSNLWFGACQVGKSAACQ